MKRALDDFDVRTQGDLDGLCGVYSIVHFLLRYRGTNSSPVGRRFFRLALEGLENAKCLSPKKIRDGFGQGLLRQAFAYVVEKESLALEAVPLLGFAKQHEKESLLEVLKVLQPNEAVLAHLPTPQHWVLAHSPALKTFSIDDSAEGSVRQVRNNQVSGDDKPRIFSLSKGLVFLNAQTH